MSDWHKTGCVLCAQNCGLEILVEEGRMVKVRPDKDNPRSKGYVCRKGLNVIYHQYPADRITSPMKRVGDKFEPVSWDLALDEIAEKLKGIVGEHGPRSMAYIGGSSQGGHFEAAFGLSLLRSMGSNYFYSSAGQEFSGIWWVLGRMLGKQYNLAIPDEHNAEVLVGWGWNGMMSHQMPRARKVLKEISNDPDRLLVVIDPRRSETAAIADIHLPVRPGSDALLVKAMISLIVSKGWENREYLGAHAEGWDIVKPWFENFDISGALEVCGVSHEQCLDLCRIFATRRWCMHPDLGIYMGRHSVLNSYLMNLLAVICGRVGVPGGNVVPGMIMPLGFHSDERDEKTWRTVKTRMPPAAAGSFPPSVLPEEILSDDPKRIRAVIASAVNPLRSYPDTTAYEKAFDALDLLVVNDIVMSETARRAHYVLPCRTFYESWDGTFFPWTFPEVYFQLRRPVVKPPEDCLEASQIFTLLADRMGILPEIPEDLMEAAHKDRFSFGAKLMEFGGEHPEALELMPFILGKTLGKAWDSAAKAALWGMLMTAPKTFRKNAARAGFSTGFDQGDRIFQALLDNPQGMWVGRVDPGENMSEVKTSSGKIELHIPELETWARELTAEGEARDLEMPEELPMILNAGRHMDYNINTLMRNPEWNRGKRACTIAVNPGDAERMNFTDGQMVRVTTEAGSEKGELQVSDQVREGTVLIPHGFGLIYDGEVYGINVNKLTSAKNRDLMGTPMHRYVPCRVDAA